MNKHFSRVFSTFPSPAKMRLPLIFGMLLHLTLSDSKIIIESYKYAFNSNYMQVEFVIFNNSAGGYSYNATKTFLTNLVQSVSVSFKLD